MMNGMSPPYSYAPGDGPAPVPDPLPARRGSKTVAIAFVFAVLAVCLLGLVVTVVAGNGGGTDPGPVAPVTATTTDAPPASSAPQAAAKAAKAPAVVLDAGTYEIGRVTDADADVIAPGRWKIRAAADGINCYWARLKDFDGELTSIRANGNVAAGKTAIVNVKASDAGLELLGDCEARR